MQKVHTVVALVQGKKSSWQKFMTKVHRCWGKGERAPTSGLIRTYQAKDEGGEKLPDEVRRVQVVAKHILANVVEEASTFYDLIYAQEFANTYAKADIFVDGKPLMKDVPVGFLMFLEKQLTDMRTLLTEVPVLPDDQTWEWDGNRGCFITQPFETIRTAKVQEPLTLYPATKEHPAQTQLLTKDLPVGTWTNINMSGGWPRDIRDGVLKRLDYLKSAVVVARENANTGEVEIKKVSSVLFDYIFQDDLK
jgi:hypothetical protein